MIPVDVNEIEEKNLIALCDDRVAESRTLDYKASLGRDDNAKKEFLKDVVAMANDAGGDLVFGVKEDGNGVAVSVCRLEGEDEDAAIRRLRQLLTDAVEPSLVGVQIHPVALREGFAIVVRVPMSYLGPHSFTLSGRRRFSIRNERNSNDMTYDQIRTAFQRTSSLVDQAREFVRKRTTALSETEGSPLPLAPGPRFVLHLAPLSAFGARASVDLHQLKQRSHEFQTPKWHSGRAVFNVDGLLVHDYADPCARYSLVFRSGAMESVWAYKLSDNAQNTNSLPSALVADHYRSIIPKILKIASDSGLRGPCVVSAALLGVGGLSLHHQSAHDDSGPARADRDNLVMPAQWLEELHTARADAVAQELLNVVWQSFGLDACPSPPLQSTT
jgi:Putative DNA-binding domain